MSPPFSRGASFRRLGTGQDNPPVDAIEILMTHLTRMSKGIICATGITRSGQHVRPLYRGNNLSYRYLARFGGPLSIGAVARIPVGTEKPTSPHIEDYVFSSESISLAQQVGASRFVEVLSEWAKETPTDALGTALRKIGSESHGITEGSGERSLSYLSGVQGAEIFIRVSRNGNPRPRLRFMSGGFPYGLSITDCRMYLNDLSNPDEKKVDWMRDIVAGEEYLLVIGLSRALEGVHWLQINGIYPVIDPYRANAPQ